MSRFAAQRLKARRTVVMIEDRVQEGIDLLDREGPDDWFDLVDLDDFVFHSCTKCVLGWTHGSFKDGCYNLSINPYQAWQYGFDNGPDDPWSHETLLVAAWRRAINSRRALVAAS